MTDEDVFAKLLVEERVAQAKVIMEHLARGPIPDNVPILSFTMHFDDGEELTVEMEFKDS